MAVSKCNPDTTAANMIYDGEHKEYNILFLTPYIDSPVIILKCRSRFRKLLHAPTMFWQLYKLNHDVRLCINLVINYIKQEP